MKLKRTPDDFLVEEIADVPTGDGPFALYRLTKRSLGTPEAIEAILRRWKLSRGAISYGGLKDRHAVTSQYVTIHRGPRRDQQQQNFDLMYVGQTGRRFQPQDIAANRFRIVLRDLRPEEARHVVDQLEEVRLDGVPNYFDDQRFGSFGVSGDFVAKAWCLGDYERALWLALAEPNPHDRSREKEEKRLLRDHWGNWTKCKELLGRSHRRSIVTYLVDHPADFRRAFSLLRQDLRSLYLSAFQSLLWNRVLSAVLTEQCRPEQRFEVELGGDRVSFFRDLDEEQRERFGSLELPLPSARIKLEGHPYQQVYERVVAELGMELRELRVKFPRDSFFSKSQRAAIVRPGEVSADVAEDELYPGRRAAALSFVLPRGCYATIVVKRVTPGVVDAGEAIVSETDDST